MRSAREIAQSYLESWFAAGGQSSETIHASLANLITEAQCEALEWAAQQDVNCKQCTADAIRAEAARLREVQP